MFNGECDECKAGGVCFGCDENYAFGQRCAKRQIFLVPAKEVEEDDGDEDIEGEEEAVFPKIFCSCAVRGSQLSSYEGDGTCRLQQAAHPHGPR